MNTQTQPHPLSLPSPFSRSRELRSPVGSTLGQQGPCDARHFIGQRDRDDLERTPRQELCEPWVFFGVLASTPQDSMRTNDQDATQVAIALFGDRPELPSAAGRI
jgi:hypothetical protein